MVLSRKDILNADDIIYEEVDTPEWGGKIRVRTLRGSDRSRVMDLISDDETKQDWIERIIIACACDEKGDPIFTNKDVDQLNKKSGRALMRVFKVADELNLLSDGAKEKAKGE